MLGQAHLIVLKRFHAKFLELALAKPRDQHLRAPSLSEILDADRAAWTAVTELFYDSKWSLSDILKPKPESPATDPAKTSTPPPKSGKWDNSWLPQTSRWQGHLHEVPLEQVQVRSHLQIRSPMPHPEVQRGTLRRLAHGSQAQGCTTLTCSASR